MRKVYAAGLVLAMFPLGGCFGFAASSAPTVITPTACSSLVGPSLRADVPPVDLPSLQAEAEDWIVAFDGQTGRLDTANAYKRAALEVIEGCEKRDAAVADRLTRPWWRMW